MTSWDDLHEQAEDKQASGGKVKKFIDGPFLVSIFRVRDEAGNLLGELTISELTVTKPTAIADKCYRVKVRDRFSEVVKKVEEEDIAKKMLGKMRRERNDGFPDEDQ